MIGFNKIALFLSLLFLFMLGINYQGKQDYDYSGIDSLPSRDGVTRVDFKFLGGFEYTTESEIPEPVKALDGKIIEVSGYILPVDTKKGKVTSFMIMKDRMTCCFDVMPRNNEFIFARMESNESIDYVKDVLVTVRGVLEIGKENVVDGIYTINVNDLSVEG